MVSQITEGIKISVITAYQPQFSSGDQSHYVFTYDVTIENTSEYTIQLMRRNWLIFDTNGEIRTVEGEGVVGQQPVLEPGQSHRYVSGCNLKTTIGKMEGSYIMERQIDGKLFSVAIPEFTLIAPFKLN